MKRIKRIKMANIHILNGDALLERFPSNIEGERIVARECLIDGDVSGDTFDAFMTNRAKYLASYDDITEQDYYDKSKTEYQKIRALNVDHQVNLWFEEDLFCQVNLWYISSLLLKAGFKTCQLVRPNKGNEYSFAHMTNADLLSAYQTSTKLFEQELQFLSSCWLAYVKHDDEMFKQLMQNPPQSLSFVVKAIEAELARRPDSDGLGKPEKELLRIIENKKANNENVTFGAVFSEFYSTMGVYSFGDLQVKRMFDQLVGD